MTSDVYFPRVNGVSTSIETVRRSLATRGIAIDLIAPDYPAGGDGRHGERHDGTISRIRSRPVPRDPEDRLMNYRAAVAAGQRLFPDLIHIQTPFVAHYAGLKLARWHRVPVIATYHTLFEEYLHHYVPLAPRGLTALLARRISARQCNALDAVIVPSSAMHDRLRRYGVHTPIHVLPTGVPLTDFANGRGEDFRARYRIAPERRIALFVGRVAGEKNIDFLLHVAARCKAQHPELLWVIAGDGPALPQLRALTRRLGLEGNTLFVGYLDRKTGLTDCYAAADLFVFASRTETQGLVLLEAMAAGIPVVALAEMGTCDILGTRRGALVPGANHAAFAEAVSGLLRNDDLRRKLGQDARSWSLEWSDAAMSDRLLGLYRQIGTTVRRLQVVSATS